MAAHPLGEAVRQILRSLAPKSGDTDAQLLARFADAGDEAAFEVLLERHGPMVWLTCRRIARQAADADDAFQATFLILCRKAGSIGHEDPAAGRREGYLGMDLGTGRLSGAIADRRAWLRPVQLGNYERRTAAHSNIECRARCQASVSDRLMDKLIRAVPDVIRASPGPRSESGASEYTRTELVQLMLELTADNALDYLRDCGFIRGEEARAEPLGGGVSNLVLRIATPERNFILKQSRPQLRTRDTWLSDLDRIYREQEIMQVLYPLLPKGTVPEVLFSDRANYVFAMSHAPAGSQVWKEALLAGQVDPAVAERAGRILGQIHETTARDTSLVERFAEHTNFVQLRVDPFYRRIQERRPEVAEAIEPIITRLLSCKAALCHGDYSPKNILTHAEGFTLVDYETAHFGDPTMDLGFFLSHLILKGIKHSPDYQRFFELTRVFWRRYESMVRFRPLSELQAEGIEHFAICALARIDGTSPVDYLPEEPKREAVRCIGRRILSERPTRWETVLGLCESCLNTT